MTFGPWVFQKYKYITNKNTVHTVQAALGRELGGGERGENEGWLARAPTVLLWKESSHPVH